MSDNNNNKRVIFTEGGKGGVGKTTLAVMLADWYGHNGVGFAPLDFDVENREASGFQHFVPAARKFDIQARGSLDAILEIIEDPAVDVALIDQAAASGAVTFRWFAEMAEALAEMGVKFTAVGMVTSDPGSVVSVLQWANALQKKVDYLIVLNQMQEPDEKFNAWTTSPEAEGYRKALKPRVMTMESRMGELEELTRAAGVTLRAVADGKGPGELASLRWKLRAKGCLERVHRQLDEVSALLLP